MALVIDGLLSAKTLRVHATPDEYAAGEDLAELVDDILLQPGRAAGLLPGAPVLSAVVDWSSGLLGGGCHCGVPASGTLCRHVVAVGLATLDHARQQPELFRPPELSPVDRWVAGLTVEQLRSLVGDLAAASPDSLRVLTTQAALATGDTSELVADLLEKVGETLAPDGHLDASDSYMVGEDAGELVDELEAHLVDGHPEVVVAPLQLTLTLLHDLLADADDEDGMLREAGQHAADLYAHACEDADVEGDDVATWLSAFREPTTRRGRAAQPGRRGPARQPQHVVGQTTLELSDLDADLSLMGHTTDPPYGVLLARLDDAGRADDALRVVDHAVAADRVSLRYSGVFGGHRWLDPSDVAFRYLAAGRPDDALHALRAVFVREPSDESYQVLLGCAARVDALDEQRDWAMQHARARAEHDGHGGLLVTLLLTEGDIDGALSVVDELGAGGAWVILAKAVEETDPARAAELHRPALGAHLRHTDKRSYQMVAAVLVAMRTLYDAAGTRAAFDAEIRELRTTYKRRRLLLKELNKAKLPR